MITETPNYDVNATTIRNDSEDCIYFKTTLIFDSAQLLRVIITWMLFFISACGNIFILHCLWGKRRTSHVHVITLHLTLADLAFTFLTIPIDGVWNVTMAWKGGEFLCRTCQFLKQFGMYISSFMVVVMAMDRMISILSPMSTTSLQQKRTKIMLIVAWVMSVLSAIPAAVIFTLKEKIFCPDEPAFVQCIDFENVSQEFLKPYFFFTMLMSFIFPFLLAFISYTLVLVEITNMQRRDQIIMGRRESANRASIARARKKTLILTSMVTTTFIFFWGPYYAMGIYSWLSPQAAENLPKEISVWLFAVMYFHPSLHPLIYGVFMKDVRKEFMLITRGSFSCIFCKKFSSFKSGDSAKSDKGMHKHDSSALLLRCNSTTAVTNLPLSTMNETIDSEVNSEENITLIIG